MIRGYEFDQNIRLNFGLAGDLFPSSPPVTSPPFIFVAGVDEVGRGPLAGPVVAAAVILPDEPKIEDLNDSKALSEKKRILLAEEIKKTAIAFSIAIVENSVIDSINILAASLKAMRDAVRTLSVLPQLVLVDGNQKPGTGQPERAIVKGDSLSASIMAASILAKVTRDQMMVEAHEKYPEYGFDGHKGYGAKSHIEAIKKFGPSPLHRLTFEPTRSLLKNEKILI